MREFIFWLIVAAIFYLGWRYDVKPTSLWDAPNIRTELQQELSNNEFIRQ